MSISFPQNKFVIEMKHKYAVGDKVRTKDGAEVEITSLMPYTFVAPAYYVRVNGMVFALSERSIEPIGG